MNKEKIIQAGKIAQQIKDYARKIVKKDVPLLEIAEKLEAKIIELGGKPAFPVNLSINEIAAHYTPSYDDKTKTEGLLKVDIGVSVDGFLADTAFSLDLENNEKNKELIEASKKALENAKKILKPGIKTSEIGETIQETISSLGFSPIINLSGHSLDEYDLHAGITIPNINDERKEILEEGAFAIEPFATTGSGRVYDGKPSGIYMIQEEKTTRSQTAREVLEFIIENYKTLPFCSRWLVKALGTKSLIGLKQLEEQGILHQFAQLVEASKAIVSQAEDTILIIKKDVIVTTS